MAFDGAHVREALNKIPGGPDHHASTTSTDSNANAEEQSFNEHRSTVCRLTAITSVGSIRSSVSFIGSGPSVSVQHENAFAGIGALAFDTPLHDHADGMHDELDDLCQEASVQPPPIDHHYCWSISYSCIRSSALTSAGLEALLDDVAARFPTIQSVEPESKPDDAAEAFATNGEIWNMADAGHLANVPQHNIPQSFEPELEPHDAVLAVATDEETWNPTDDSESASCPKQAHNIPKVSDIQYGTVDPHSSGEKVLGETNRMVMNLDLEKVGAIPTNSRRAKVKGQLRMVSWAMFIVFLAFLFMYRVEGLGWYLAWMLLLGITWAIVIFLLWQRNEGCW